MGKLFELGDLLEVKFFIVIWVFFIVSKFLYNLFCVGDKKVEREFSRLFCLDGFVIVVEKRDE